MPMVKHIPSLHPDYRECILDIDIFGRIVSAPQLSYEQLKEMLFEEYAQRTPMPTLETKRYELSRPVSDDYRVSYGGDLELQDNESLVDLQSKSSGVVFEDLSSLIPGNIHSEVQELFRYEYGAHDDFRQRIIDEYDVESLEEFKPGVRAMENIVGSTSEDESLVLSDEAVERLGEEPEEEGQLAESGDDDVPSWMQGVMAYGQVDDSDTDTEENGDMSVADDEQEQMSSDDDDYDVYAGYDDEVVEGSEDSDDSGGDAEGDSEYYVDVYAEDSDEEVAEEGYTDVHAEDQEGDGEEVAEEGYTDVYSEDSEDSDGDYVDVYAEVSEGDDTSQVVAEDGQDDFGGPEPGVVPADEPDDSGVGDDDGVDFGDMTPDAPDSEQVGDSDDGVDYGDIDSDDGVDFGDMPPDDEQESEQVGDQDGGVDYGDVDSDDGVDFGDMDAEGEEEVEDGSEQSEVGVTGSDDDDVYFGDVEEEQDDGVDFGDIQEEEQEDDDSREEVEEETYREEATETVTSGWPNAGGSESGQFGEDDGVDFIDDLDDGIDFVDSPKSGSISPNPGVVQPPAQYKPQKPVPVARPSPEQEFDRSSEPTDIRAFVRKHPRCEVQFALKFFTKKQIDDAVRLGRIIKKGNTLR